MKKAGTLSLVLMNLTRTLPLLTGGAMMGTDSQVFCRRESSQRTSPGASPSSGRASVTSTPRPRRTSYGVTVET